MRVVQLIDSLEPGGAERMAVNIANGLANKISYSGLVSTRGEGALKKSISPNVPYLYLGKKKTFDFKALWVLRSFFKKNNIEVLHAHGSSYFFAILLKIILPEIKVIWHDHLGSRVNGKKGNIFIKLFSIFFSGVLAVNEELELWAKENLYCNRIMFLPNFAVIDEVNSDTKLKGVDGKRIVCLANLKNPKNHLFLLNAFYKSEIAKFGWTLHLIGYDYMDSYSKELKRYVEEKDLDESVYIYGSKNDINNILNQSSVGILPSLSEGFPVTILEYSLAKLAVVSTNVGYCNSILDERKTGLLFSPYNEMELILKLKQVTSDMILRNQLASSCHKVLSSQFSENIICNNLILFYVEK